MGIMVIDQGTSTKIISVIFLVPASYFVCVYPFWLTEKISFDQRFTYFLYVAGPLGAIVLTLLLLQRFIKKQSPVILEIVVVILWSMFTLIAGVTVMRGHTLPIYNETTHALQENDVVKYLTGVSFVIAGLVLAFDGMRLTIGGRKEATAKEGEGKVEANSGGGEGAAEEATAPLD